MVVRVQTYWTIPNLLLFPLSIVTVWVLDTYFGCAPSPSTNAQDLHCPHRP